MTADIDEFRTQVRKFIEANAPDGTWSDGVRVPRDAETERRVRDWYVALFEVGYIGGGWPERHGGRAGHTPRHDAVVMEEIVRARVPRPIDQVLLAAHLIITFGTDEQHQRYLPRIRSAKDIWCQLFSEPGVGSDLARLTTKAIRLPDGNFRVDGQKVWTTDGQWAQGGVLLARTDSAAKPHAGLTVFLLDMSTPGVDVRPIREMTGSAEFCEVYLDDVIVPETQVLGEVNRGWGVVNSGLASERAYVGANAVMLDLLFDDLIELAQYIELPGGTSAIEDPVIRDGIAGIRARVGAVALIAAEAVEKLGTGTDDPADGLIAKLAYTELNVAMCAHAMTILSAGVLRPEGEPVHARWRQAFLWSRALTISGGSSEIVRNVLATQLLGLPRSW
ncbi:acyl-CoA dehydrogenase family protein [Aldersonia kunmingensis]|uniref:acyl-CoA dehydrogenase family protein n=1 Tax=Aldersonia kunmingensis TaxID=408066 RepID=UPI000836F34B|nr:acyl-CoA dehydrogenase family protein [Aldersonia kunmingensis]